MHSELIDPELIYIPAGPFLMGTGDDQIAQLASMDELAREWQEKGYFQREQPQQEIPYLPTEAEWEKAARGTGGQQYPWGDIFDALRCNTRSSALGQTTSMGRYSPKGDSPYRCGEMAGNASQWTLSKFWPYPYADDDGRNDAEGDAERVIRGGSWSKPPLRARTAARGMNDPFFTDSDLGFRCACTL